MGTLNALLALAKGRAEAMGLPYEGALTPTEAFDVWQKAPGARLVDVRTAAELQWVGRIPHAVEIEWLSWPGSAQNPHFANQLHQQVEREALVLFLCRSGARSDKAARLAHEHGYTAVYNVLEGFEGDLDAKDQRNHLGGWRHAGLPWKQN